MYGILKIDINTNIPGFKKVFDYNPSMTVKGVSKDTNIYFPTKIPLTLQDLGGNETGKHDKIKIFLSESRLNSIINLKRKPTESDDAGDRNIKLILDLLFSSDENVFLNEKAYTILDAETIDNPFFKPKVCPEEEEEILLIKEKKPRSTQSGDSSIENQEEIEMQIRRVRLTLLKGGEISSSTKGCEKQKLVINEKMKIVKTFFDKPGKLEKPENQGKKKLKIPAGYINPCDWKKVKRDAIFGSREYYANKQTGDTQYELPVPFKFRKRIKEWNDGEPPPPPADTSSSLPMAQPLAQPVAPPMASTMQSSDPSDPSDKKVSFAPTGGRKTRKYKGGNKINKTLKAKSRKISRALKKKKMDAGNISVFLASETPNKYFSKREIAGLTK